MQLRSQTRRQTQSTPPASRVTRPINNTSLSPSATVRNTTADSVSDSISRDQAGHQSHPEPLSTSITSAQTYGQEQAFQATHAAETVLGILELLLLIIAEVPLDHRTSLRRVSKTWEAAVNKVGHMLEPLGYGTMVSHQGANMDWLNVHCVPIYPITDQSRRRVLKPNRRAGLCNLRLRRFASTPYSFNSIQQLYLEQRHRKKLIKHKNEFMTDPPITQALVGLAILRVPGGIRIGDLLEIPGSVVFGWDLAA
jgi:hypothetical protein